MGSNKTLCLAMLVMAFIIMPHHAKSAIGAALSWSRVTVAGYSQYAETKEEKHKVRRSFFNRKARVTRPTLSEELKTDPQAILAFVLSILAMIGSLFFLGAAFGLLGTLVSLKTLSNFKKYPGRYKGKSLTKIALVLSLTGMALTVLSVFLVASLF